LILLFFLQHHIMPASSCNLCRMLHIRCEGGIPCNRCRMRNVVCEPPPVPSPLRSATTFSPPPPTWVWNLPPSIVDPEIAEAAHTLVRMNNDALKDAYPTTTQQTVMSLSLSLPLHAPKIPSLGLDRFVLSCVCGNCLPAWVHVM
jgi:hypothetical protein